MPPSPCRRRWPARAGAAEARARRDAFEAAYRRWLAEHASFAGSGAERMEKLRPVLMAAAAAPDLGGALDTIIRFGRLTAPELSPTHLAVAGDVAVLRFDPRTGRTLPTLPTILIRLPEQTRGKAGGPRRRT